MKRPSEMLFTISHIFGVKKTICNLFFHFVLLYTFANECAGHTQGSWVFVSQKYEKNFRVSLGHFIKHNPLISEE